ncbi:MAG: D-aminoacyl-tRNA deacylase [Planctomycetota bacterium]
MKIVLQRVERAAVRVAEQEVVAIGAGLCLLVCVETGDSESVVCALAEKVAGLRVFPDAEGATNLDLLAVGGAVLVVPQFTLAAEWRHGRRPSFTGAAPPAEARRLLGHFVRALSARLPRVAEAPFGADMSVELVNAGPFTLLLKDRGSAATGPA